MSKLQPGELCIDIYPGDSRTLCLVVATTKDDPDDPRKFRYVMYSDGEIELRLTEDLEPLQGWVEQLPYCGGREC
jgi:hypothetical protein